MISKYLTTLRKISVVVYIMILSTAASAQKGSMSKPFVFKEQFKHGAGLGVVLTKVGKTHEPSSVVSYSPNLSLTRSYSDFSISVGSHMSAGYHIASDVEDSSYVIADLPVLVEFNFGHNASKDFYSDFGFFVGGGYSYNLFRERWQSGPAGTIGVRTFIFGPSFTIRYLRFFATAYNDVSLHNLSLSLNIGRYFEQVKMNNKVSRFNFSKPKRR